MYERSVTGFDLLQRIPEDLWDVPHKDLEGGTPRMAVSHVDELKCQLCRRVLEDMGRE